MADGATSELIFDFIRHLLYTNIGSGKHSLVAVLKKVRGSNPQQPIAFGKLDAVRRFNSSGVG